MLIRSMDGRITLWSPAMKQRYGFTSDQARAQIAHQLLRTIFWKPLHEVEGALLEQKAWSGGLIHHRLDGRPVVTAAYWHLHLDVTGGEPVVVELHSDIVPVGDSVSNQLADVMAILAHEFSQPVTAISNYVNATRRSLQSDRPLLCEALSAAAVEIDRIKRYMADFREMAEAMRSPFGNG